ncbi:MAG: hypothetical protein AB7G36_18930 [Candidatus Nanopelagicales bacterium]
MVAEAVPVLAGCVAPAVEGGLCGQPVVRTCGGIIVGRDGAERRCTDALCADTACGVAHFTTHGLSEARVEEWRELRERANRQRRNWHGSAGDKGPGL